MKKEVFIPTLKVTNYAIGCVYPHVFCLSIKADKATAEIMAAKERQEGEIVAFNVERIACDNFLGNRLEWLDKHAICKRGRYEYVLSCSDGGVFLNLIKGGNLGTDDSLRHKAIEYVESMSDDELDNMVVRSHNSTTHQWVKCYPDGSVSEAEEADNDTTHWIDYPNKEVATIYDICHASAEACNCDICTMYRYFEETYKDDFYERYGEEEWDYCNETSLEDAILEFERDNDGLTGEDIRERMIQAIEDIEHGYFDDEV